MRPGTDRDGPQPIDRLVPSPQQADIGFLRDQGRGLGFVGVGDDGQLVGEPRESLLGQDLPEQLAQQRRLVARPVGRDADDVAVADQERDHQRVQEHGVDVRRRDVKGKAAGNPDRPGLLERGEAIRQPLDRRAAKPESDRDHLRERPRAGIVQDRAATARR